LVDVTDVKVASWGSSIQKPWEDAVAPTAEMLDASGITLNVIVVEPGTVIPAAGLPVARSVPSSLP